MKSKVSMGYRFFSVLNYLFMIFFIAVCLLPIVHVVCASISDPMWVMEQRGIIWRVKGFNFNGYKTIFKNINIVTGYVNTFIYVGAATAIGMVLTVMTAYAVSRTETLFANAIMFLISFTMLFNGGIITSYIVNTKYLHLLDTRWSIILPSCMNVFNLILIRTAMAGVPKELEECARLEGAGELQILTKIVLPLIKATMATVILYYIVAHWNSWFQASIYLRDRSKFPLQLIMKEILVSNDVSSVAQISSSDYAGDTIKYNQLIKYCTIVVSSLPVIAFYPFVQKYFESGVMIGAIKG